MRIGENYVAHSLVIFDITGAAAKVAVERFSDGSRRSRIPISERTKG
jgi:hypothetical protein